MVTDSTAIHSVSRARRALEKETAVEAVVAHSPTPGVSETHAKLTPRLPLAHPSPSMASRGLTPEERERVRKYGTRTPSCLGASDFRFLKCGVCKFGLDEQPGLSDSVSFEEEAPEDAADAPADAPLLQWSSCGHVIHSDCLALQSQKTARFSAKDERTRCSLCYRLWEPVGEDCTLVALDRDFRNQLYVRRDPPLTHQDEMRAALRRAEFAEQEIDKLRAETERLRSELLCADSAAALSTLRLDPQEEVATFGSLPRALQVAVLRLLPLDERARCSVVCTSWYFAANDVALWSHLSGPGAWKAASAKPPARKDWLVTLDVSASSAPCRSALRSIVYANSRTLEELRTHYGDGGYALSLLKCAPRLKSLSFVEAPGLGVLELLHLLSTYGHALQMPHIRLLTSGGADAAHFSALSRLLRSLPVLSFIAPDVTFSHPMAAPLIEALTGHPTLRKVSLRYPALGTPFDPAVVELTARILSADAPALRSVDFNHKLPEAELAIILDRGLAQNTHLRSFTCSVECLNGDAFEEEHVLPAVRACESLEKILVEGYIGNGGWGSLKRGAEVIKTRRGLGASDTEESVEGTDDDPPGFLLG